jgi:hypothetical protein
MVPNVDNRLSHLKGVQVHGIYTFVVHKVPKTITLKTYLIYRHYVSKAMDLKAHGGPFHSNPPTHHSPTWRI